MKKNVLLNAAVAFGFIFVMIILSRVPQKSLEPKFKSNECIAYFTLNEVVDMNGNVVSRPTCTVTNSIWTVKAIKNGIYILEEAVQYRGLDREATIDYIDNNYVKVNCDEAKLK